MDPNGGAYSVHPDSWWGGGRAGLIGMFDVCGRTGLLILGGRLFVQEKISV